MMFDRSYFAGKVAAVTGGASGVGLALCEELLESGAAKVVLLDFNRENLARQEAALAAHYPGKVLGLPCNVTVEKEVQQVLEKVCAFGDGRLDIMINCAGSGLPGRFTREPEASDQTSPLMQCKVATNEDWEKGFALNFYGPVYGCRHALPVMLRQGSGQIVNIISGIAFSPMAYQSMYAATKAALNVLTLSLRAEYAHLGIKFNSATPGTTLTAIFAGMNPPPNAQPPRQSAQRILHGVARNDRLILGDDGDLDGVQTCFLPGVYSPLLDAAFLGFAHERKGGTLNYTVAKEQTTLPPEAEADKLALEQILQGDMSDPVALAKDLQTYLDKNRADRFPAEYFAGKTAAVTGGAAGLGLALCEELLLHGARRVVLADRNREGLEAQATRLGGQYPGRVLGVVCDVADEEAVRAMIARSADFFSGSFDLLINCVGICQRGRFADTQEGHEIEALLPVASQTHLESLFTTNFYGPLYGCRAVLPLMLKQGQGQIVNLLSGTGIVGMPYQSLYASSQAALNLLTLVLRYEYWDDGIKCNSATSGATASPGASPVDAQAARQSALRILTGLARNDRLITGDDADTMGAICWGNPKTAGLFDTAMMEMAALGRKGKLPGCAGVLHR